MTEYTPTLAERIENLMRDQGLSDEPWQFDSNIHSWRCEHPERYGRCKCFQDFRDELVTMVAEHDRQVQEKLWDEIVPQYAHDWYWHDGGREQNPYRKEAAGD